MSQNKDFFGEHEDSEYDSDSDSNASSIEYPFISHIIEQVLFDDDEEEEDDEETNNEDDEEKLETHNNWTKLKTELYNYGILTNKMSNDPLWQKILKKAKLYKNNNRDINCTISEGIEHAVAEFKPIVKTVLQEMEDDNDDEEDDNDDEEETDDNSMDDTGLGIPRNQ